MAVRRNLIGAHLSVAGGLPRCLPRVDELGVEVVQLFVASSRAWAQPPLTAESDEGFRISCSERSVPVFVHAPYLINLGSPDQRTLQQSSDALAFSLRRGAAVGARGVVVHAGSSVGAARSRALVQVRERLLSVLDATPDGPAVLIEPTAGGGAALAGDAASLHEFMSVMGPHERLGVCLDTCHMHASGHDLSTGAGFRAALKAFGAAAGPAPISLVHVNDSRDPANSKRDRHEVIGEGTIGREPFGVLFSSPVTRGVPLVVESPPEHHARQLATLNALREAK